MKKIRYLKELSLFKTLYFNFKYFGFAGIKFPCLISKNTKLKKLSGEIILKKNKFGLVKIGFGGIGIFDEKYSRAIWENSGTVIFFGKANIGIASKLINNGLLEIGNLFNITAGTSIICYKKIKFGNNVLISWDNLIMDTDFHKIRNVESKAILNLDKNIEIKNNVWIGCRNTILKGSYIDNNTVISSNNLINSSFKGKCNIVIGNEKKIIKENIYWEA